MRDDLVGTGGRIEGWMKVVEELGGVVGGIGFLIEVRYVDGRKKVDG